MDSSLSKVTSRSLPDLSCPHHLHHHSLQHQLHPLTQETSESPSGVKRQPLLLSRDNHNHKLSLLSSSHFRPFFHSSSSSLSSESCHSHSLPHNPLLSKDPSAKTPSEEDFESLKLISNGAYGCVLLFLLFSVPLSPSVYPVWSGDGDFLCPLRLPSSRL